MTDSDTRTRKRKPRRSERFATIAGFSAYEFGDLGEVHSVDRVTDGKPYRGTVLRPRVGNRGYLLVNLTDDTGRKVTRTVHTLVLEAHAGPRPHGHEACHGDDVPSHNWYPENLAWKPPAENVADRMRNRPAQPKPERHCARCGTVLDPGRGGKRCHACVTEIGEQAAGLLRAGVTLEDVGRRLEYPHLSGLHQLARTYGGYGLPPAQPSQTVTGRRTALATLRDRWRKRGW
jgi:hypothetical protein